MHPKRISILGIALLLLFGPALWPACYGKFALTRWVHTFNGRITDNTFVHTLVMWGFIIVPIYEVAALGDLIIFNTVETFTGTNPLDGLAVPPKVEIKTKTRADGSVQFATRDALYRLEPGGDRSANVYRDSLFVGTVCGEPDGKLVMRDAEGHPLATARLDPR